MKVIKSFLKKYCGVKREISGNIFVGGKVTRYFALSLPFASRVQLATRLNTCASDFTQDSANIGDSLFINALADSAQTAIKAPVKVSMGGGSRI